MNPQRRQHVIWLACLMGAIGLSAALVVVGLAAGQARAAERPAWASLQPDEALAEPRRFLFLPVKMRGEIVRLVGGRAFALHSRSVRHGLLVVLSDQAMEAGGPLAVGDPVEVEGIVRFLGRQEMQTLQARFGIDLGRDNLPVAYGNHPYLLALRVRRVSTST